MDKKPKKKFKETKVGKFLINTGSDIMSVIGDVLPNEGWMGIVKNLIQRDEKLSEQQREMAIMLLEADVAEMNAISSRWKSDMESDNWLSKNVRPVSLIFLTVMTVVIIFFDSYENSFEIDSAWIDLLKTLLITVYFAYFGSRGYEKAKVIVGKYNNK